MKRTQRSRIGQMAAVGLIIGGVAIAWMSSVSQGERPVASLEAASVSNSGRIAAPDFALPDLDDKTVRLSDSGGTVRIVDFWTTWCPPCRQEIPHFQKLHETYGGKGLTMIGVSLDEKGAEVVRPFAGQMKMTYTSVIGNPGTAMAYGGIQAIPTTFVIDKAGRVYKKYVGYRDYATFEADVKTLMAE